MALKSKSASSSTQKRKRESSKGSKFSSKPKKGHEQPTATVRLKNKEQLRDLDNNNDKSTRRSSRKKNPTSFYGMYEHTKEHSSEKKRQKKTKTTFDQIENERKTFRVEWKEEEILCHSKFIKLKEGIDQLHNFYLQCASRKVEGVSWYESILKNDPDLRAKKIRRWCMDRRNYLKPFFIKNGGKEGNSIYARKLINLCTNVYDSLSSHLGENGIDDFPLELRNVPELDKINSLLGAHCPEKGRSTIENDVSRLDKWYKQNMSDSPPKDCIYHNLLLKSKSSQALDLKLWCKQKRKYMKPILLGKKPATPLSENCIELLTKLYNSLSQKFETASLYATTPVEKVCSLIGSIHTGKRKTIDIDFLGNYYREHAFMKQKGETWFHGILWKDKSMRAEKLKIWCCDRRKVMKLYFLQTNCDGIRPSINTTNYRVQQATMYVQLWNSLNNNNDDELPSFNQPTSSDLHKISSLIGHIKLKDGEENSSHPKSVKEEMD